MAQQTKAWLFQEWSWWVAQALQPDIASQGGSPQEALENLKQAIQLHEQAPAAAASRLPESFAAPPGAQLVELALAV